MRNGIPLQAYLPPDLHHRLRALAARNQRPVKVEVVNALARYLSDPPANSQPVVMTPAADEGPALLPSPASSQAMTTGDAQEGEAPPDLPLAPG
jgi:hypothetical protein